MNPAGFPETWIRVHSLNPAGFPETWIRVHSLNPAGFPETRIRDSLIESSWFAETRIREQGFLTLKVFISDKFSWKEMRKSFLYITKIVYNQLLES